MYYIKLLPLILQHFLATQSIYGIIVIKHGVQRGAEVIRIIVDKPAYLPKPRDSLHQKRSGITGKLNLDDCTIGDEEMIPQCTRYQQMLANGTLKQTLISYIMTKFIKFGSDNPMTVQLVLDYQDLDCPCSIYMGGKSDLPMLKNKNGEADYNLWFHCMASTSSTW